jgi:hypothetical protein
MRYHSDISKGTAMSQRFYVFERIAFSFVVLSAMLCSAYIAYETDPDVQQVLQAGKTALRLSGEYSSGEYSFACASPVTQGCADYPAN